MEAILTFARERDCDLMLMRLLENNKYIRELFLNEVGFNNANITSISQNQKSKNGESDLVIKGILQGKKIEILIEDKIDAPAMKMQYERYQMRGEEDIEKGIIDQYAVILFSPLKYYESNSMAKKYPHHILYENVLEILERTGGLKTDIELLKEAINKSKGYQVVENKKVTAFWNEYYQFLTNNYHDKGLKYHDNRDKKKGNMSGWPMFQTDIKGTNIVIKSNYGWVDIHFSGMGNRLADLKYTVKELLKENEEVMPASKSGAIRIYCKKIDFNKHFEDEKDKVILAIEKVIRAYEILNKLKEKGITKSPF